MYAPTLISRFSFKNVYRFFVVLVALSIVILIAIGTTGANADGEIKCGDGIETGSFKVSFSQNEASTGKIWLNLSSERDAYFDGDLNGNQCNYTKFARPTINPSAPRWQKFTRDFNFKAGTNELIVRAFDNGITVYKVAIVTDGLEPKDDGSNVIEVTPSTSTSTTTSTPSSVSTSSTTSTNPASTSTTTTLPGQSTTTKSPVSTSTTSTTSSTTTLPGASTSTTKGWETSSSTSTSTTVVVPPTSAPNSSTVTTAPGITVAGTNVSQTTTSATNASLPFTGSSSRTMLIFALSAMLAGLIAVGISKQYLPKPTWK